MGAGPLADVSPVTGRHRTPRGTVAFSPLDALVFGHVHAIDEPSAPYTQPRGLGAALRASVRRLNSSRVHLERFVRRGADSVAPGAIVLDAGAGSAPHRDHFVHTRYETADFLEVEKS
jgi:hypothetical protein